MDRMSAMPMITTNSDEQDYRCVRKRKRRESQGKICFQFFYRIFFNDEDMSMSPAEIAYFDKSANSYNLANFKERKMDPYTATNECLTLYFLANFAIVQGNSKEGDMFVREGLQIAKLSQKPDLYTLLLASPLARVHYMEDNIEALRGHLHDCFQMIDALGRGVPGSILGWLYYMCARTHKTDRSAAIEDFQLAIDAFDRSETIDKDFGVAHTICRLIICRLGCGEKADTIDCVETPVPSEMRKVEGHFTHLKDMAIVNQCVVIRIIYLMAKTDYYFRTRNLGLSLERAREAHQLAVSSNCDEFLEVTKQRENIYTGKYNEMEADRHVQTFASQQSVNFQTQPVPCGDEPTINRITYHDGSKFPTAKDVAFQLTNLMKEVQPPSKTQILKSVEQLLQEIDMPVPAVEQNPTATGNISRPLD